MYAWSSPPMWSMGSGVRGEELKTLSNFYTPGPGNYDEVPQDVNMAAYPAWKQGTSKRPPLYGSSNKDVGPGSYEPDRPQGKKHPKKTFAKGERGHSEFKGISTVGPDAYNPKKFGRAPPAFSFGYKTDGFTAGYKSDVPGPGAYDIKDGFEEGDENGNNNRTAFNRTAPQGMTKSRQPMFGSSDLPGPGTHFNPDDKNTKDNYDFRYFTPTWSFGRSNRDDLYNETRNVPGPGKYQIAGPVSNKTGYTILGKHDRKSKDNSSGVPGPNVYNQDIAPLRKTAPSFRVGKAARKDMSTGHPDLPGPGAYFGTRTVLEEIHENFGKQDRERKDPTLNKGFGLSKRPGLYPSEAGKNPGPGEYKTIGDIAKGIKYSMGIKGGPKKTGEVYPGPGEYDPFGSIYLDKNIGAIIGTSERPGLYKKGVAPGPGQYDIRGDLGDFSKPMIGKGKRQPMSKVNDEPGPGYYNIPSAIANVQKYLLPYFPEEKRKMNKTAEASFRGIFAQST